MDQEKESSVNDPVNVLKIILQFTDADLQLAMLMLKRQKIWKDGINIDYFISDKPVVVNISTELPGAALEMCMGMMAMMLGTKEGIKPGPKRKTWEERVKEKEKQNKK